MGCQQSRETAEEREQRLLGPPSKTMDASEHCQHLVYMVKPVLDVQVLGLSDKFETLTATQMITQTVGNDQGMLYFVKVQTLNQKWPWLFLKIYEPPLITDVSKVTLKGFKKMKEEYNLITF